MKTFTCVSRFLAILFIGFFVQIARGQKMLDPKDSVITYDASKPPAQPAPGKIGKWVRTVRMTWNTNEYKCYIYQGTDFRLHFPKSYNPTANDGKKYPILVFYHGYGELGTIYDNEDQLKNGGALFQTAVDNGTFDGYVLMMQCQYAWDNIQLDNLKILIDSLVQGYKGDAYRVIQNGLSGGGQAIWYQQVINPTYFAGSIPMSGVLQQDSMAGVINLLKYTPIWNLDGGRDGNPSPSLAGAVAKAMLAAGANYVYKNYTTLGHDTWDSTWKEPNFWPFCNNVYLSNPWPLYGRTGSCSSSSISDTLGIVPGLAGYQWRRNGTVLPAATSYALIVTQPGIYDARVLRGSSWSDWSHKPVQIGFQTLAFTTIQPSCTVVTGAITMTSPVGNDILYSLDGTTYQANPSFIGLNPGAYQVTVKNNSGCVSTTATITIISAQPAMPAAIITQPTSTVKTGAITVTSPTGTGLTYSINGTVYQSGTSFSGLAPGTYALTVKNSTGCVSTSETIAIIAVQATPPAPAAVTITQPTCTLKTGTIIVTSPIGTGLTYSISGTNYQSGTSFTDLAPGTYQVTVKDSAGSISTTSTIAVINTQPATPPAPTVTITQATCALATGTIIATAPLGNDFLYSIDSMTYQSGTNFSGLAAGTYYVTVKNGSACLSTSATAVIHTMPADCTTCPEIMHKNFNDFNASSNPGTPTTLWFNLHTNLSGNQLSENGDYLLFAGGTLTFSGIGASFGNSVSLPKGEIIVDNTVSVPITSFDLSQNTWVTKVPPSNNSSDLFISGDAITSSTGFTLSGASNTTVLTGSFTSNKSFSSSWFYGLAAYQPTFTNGTADIINAANGIPVGGHQTGTPDDQTGNLVNGGSGAGGSNFTGSYSSIDNFTTCTSAGNLLPPTTSVSGIVITVYPNPYLNEVIFNITSSESGKGTLEFYDFLGQRLRIIFEGDFESGVPRTLIQRMISVQRQPVIYIFRIGNKIVHGKLLPG